MSRLVLVSMVLATAPLAVAQPAPRPPAGVIVADEWTPPEIGTGSPLELGGDEWDFRASFANRGKAKSRGDALEIKTRISVGGVDVEIVNTANPANVEPGKTFQHTFKIKPPKLDPKASASTTTVTIWAGGHTATKTFPIVAESSKK